MRENGSVTTYPNGSVRLKLLLALAARVNNEEICYTVR